MEKLKFFVITDTHYFKNSLGAFGEEYEKFMRYEQKCFAETESINKALFEYLGNSKEADIILIAGDLSFNGEKESHLAFIEELKKLREKGKKIYVITAGHDFEDNCFAFDETGRISPEGTKREELYGLYYEFGFKQAIACDRKHLSYVAQLGEGVRLLALNNDGDCGDFQTYDEEQISWIKEQTAKAKKDGQMLIAMNHYPLLPGQPIFSIVPTCVQKNGGEITTMLADEGVHLVFTGHMHNQSVNLKVTPRGNKIYDVCTGSVIACPSVMRLVTVEDKSKVDIKTIPCPDFQWDTKGKSCKQYLSDLFDSMILNLLEDMKERPEAVLRKINGGANEKLYPFIKGAGKLLNKITVGNTAALLHVKCDKSLKKVLLKNYISELVRGVFEGNQSFCEGTPKGDVLLKALDRLDFILKRIHIKTIDGEEADIKELIKNSAGNYGLDDYNVTLYLE